MDHFVFFLITSLVGRCISTLGLDGFVDEERIEEQTPGSLQILREARIVSAGETSSQKEACWFHSSI